MADDFERALLITFDYTSAVDAQLKVGLMIPIAACEACVANGLVHDASASLWRGRRAHSPCAHRYFPQARAASFIADVKKNPDVWRLAIERFSTSTHLEIRFWWVAV